MYYVIPVHVGWFMVSPGVLPTQYIKFARFSGIGSVGHGYIRQGNCHAYVLVFYNNNPIILLVYISIVGRLTEHSMQRAVEGDNTFD